MINPYPRTHRPHFMSHVQQVTRLEPGDGLQLGGGLHLEDTNCISITQHVVDFFVLEIDAGQINAFAGALFD